MEAGDTRVANLVDTVHHEIDSVVRNHCVYKSVWSPLTEQLTLEKEPVDQSIQYICSTWL